MKTFFDRLEKGQSCWTLKSGIREKSSANAPSVTVQGYPVLAHRLSYEIHIGPIPVGQEVYRTCGNNQCVNPEHLELRVSIHGKEITARFFEKVNKTETCWTWTGPTNGKGYGLIEIEGKKILTHRWSYEHHKGQIPDGLLVCHECDNPPCVNPSHLWVGTQKDNVRDAIDKGRFNANGWDIGTLRRDSTHCAMGHEFTFENTGYQAKGRYCKTCANRKKQEARARIREKAKEAHL